MTRPNDLITRSRAAVWHPCTQMKALDAVPPLAIVRGEGAWLIDADGKRYLDAISSWWVNLFGHAHPRINAALTDQLGQMAHVMLAGCTHAPVVELSERLAALSGLGHAFYASDGASATEIALKMSFHYWRNTGQPEKRRFISLKNSYHGETLGALSVTDVALFKDTYAALLNDSHQVMSPDARQAAPGETASDVARRAAADLEAWLTEHAATTAALIVEPLVQGATGMAMYDADYLRLARALCDQFNIHLIADEIAVGFGRTGTFFACEQAGITADFLLLSKGITGGYLPLACVLTTDTVYAAFYDDATARGFLHSHSYTGNPLACRAALAVLDIFATEAVLERNSQTAAQFNALLEPVRHHPRVRHFRQTGMIWAFDVVDAPPGFADHWQLAARAQGILMRPIGATVYFMPPYILDEAALQHLATTTLALLDRGT
ncbi:MAG: adenosylmethionine--8-amino-7-oxononanoate transaminase [Betaproteobacteria bacterium]|nr:MAG: adenosylmethionine--8-amino-7-oxononanoate transaminase [Betaproteobacteria bacterium]